MSIYIMSNIEISKKKIKPLKEKIIINIDIPKFSDYSTFKSKKYKIPDLKHICKFYKQKISGTKQQLIDVIYKFLYLSYNAQIIQRVWKKYCIKVYNKLHGPARKNRSICVNETDFFTMDPISEISDSQFFSYKDIDNMIYGFDILSLYNLLLKNGKNSTNPYNRNIIKNNIKNNIKKLIKFANFINEKIDIDIININTLDQKTIIELRVKSLFQEIDNLGNYTNPQWFLSLHQLSIAKFIKELYDIWDYRLNLSQNIKIEICPPNGNPFQGINLYELTSLSFEVLQSIAINCMESLITTGINIERKYLGSTYVLSAITLVNTEAAQALPWLYLSVL